MQKIISLVFGLLAFASVYLSLSPFISWVLVVAFVASYTYFQIYGGTKTKHQLEASFQSLSNQFNDFKNSAIELFGNSEKLKKEIHNEHSSIEESSSAVVEISSMSEKTADSAKSLETNSKSLESNIEQAETHINHLTETLSLIKQDSDSLKEVVFSSLTQLNQIQEEMNQIQSKTKLINEIVFQTKLLSFNASVEAARAGEYGKGFSVVASEIEKLSKNSGSAAQEIEVILKQSQSNALNIIGSISKSLEKATNEIVLNLENALEKNSHVVSNFASQKSMVVKNLQLSEEILNATQEQSLGVKQISNSLNVLTSSSKNIGQVSDVTYKTAQFLAQGSEGMSGKIFDISHQLSLKLQMQQVKFDFSAAIRAHQDWKMKLLNYMNKPDGSLDSQKVCQDNQCALGKWIYGEGQAHKEHHHHEYEILRESHAKFHVIAGKVIDHIHDHKLNEVEKMMSPEGEFTAQSNKTVSLIEDMKLKVESEENAA